MRSIQIGLSEMLSTFRQKTTRSDALTAKSDASIPEQSNSLKSENPDGLTTSSSRRVTSLLQKATQSVAGTRNARFIPIGTAIDPVEEGPDLYERYIGLVLEQIAGLDVDVVLVDCRGGIDRDTIAVCRSADGVLLIAETDAASIQAGQRLVKLLSEAEQPARTKRGFRHRKVGNLVGYVINKAFSDPIALAQAGTSFFKTIYLGSIPFDFATTRRFILGQLPDTDSIFATHVAGMAQRLFPDAGIREVKTWTGSDYDTLSMKDIPSVIGGRFAVVLIILAFYVGTAELVFSHLLDQNTNVSRATIAFGIAAFVGVMGSMEVTRRMLGKALRVYVRLVYKGMEALVILMRRT